MRRVCRNCSQNKHKDDYYPSSWDTRRNICRDCVKEASAKHYRKAVADPTTYKTRQEAWKKKNSKRKDYAAELSLKRKYNMSLVDYAQLLAAQQGVCKLCKKPPKKTRLHVDHNHATGKVRGLLCNNCNRGIGHLQDSPALCRAAAEYLEG